MKVKSYKFTVFNRVVWLLYRAPYVVVWLRSSESVQQWRWMLNVCQSCYYRHVLVVPTGSKMKTGCSTITRQTGQLCASFISLCTLYIQDYGLTWRLEVTVCSVDCVIAVSFHTGLKWLCVICCVIAVSLFLYYTGLRETWSDCVFMFGMCCVIAVSLFLYYTELRETWSDCVFMFGICCVIAVSLFLYYTGWWLYIGSLMNNAR